MPLLDSIRNRAKKAGRDGSIGELYMYFVDQCRTNLHMVIAMSPFGDAFRTRLRMFPSLVNCCTIDWFSEWPEEALRSVATNFVGSVSLISNHVLKNLKLQLKIVNFFFFNVAINIYLFFAKYLMKFICFVFSIKNEFLYLDNTIKYLFWKKKTKGN